jgi:hypothetical protein
MYTSRIPPPAGECAGMTIKKLLSVQFEIIHEQLPLPVPCYDLLPVTELTLGHEMRETSGTPNSLELTGGEYKT